MSMKTYSVAVRVLLDDNYLDEGPVHTLTSLVLSPLNEAGVCVLEISVREVDEP